MIPVSPLERGLDLYNWGTHWGHMGEFGVKDAWSVFRNALMDSSQGALGVV